MVHRYHILFHISELLLFTRKNGGSISGTVPHLACRYSTFCGREHFTFFLLCNLLILWSPNVLQKVASCCHVDFVRYDSDKASLVFFFFRWSHVRELAMKKQDELHQLVMKLQVIRLCTYHSSYFQDVAVGRIVFLRCLCSQMRTQILILIGLLVQEKIKQCFHGRLFSPENFSILFYILKIMISVTLARKITM